MHDLERLKQLVEDTRISPNEITARTRFIGEQVLSGSSYIREPNFEAVHPNDLRQVFHQYDHQFFGSLIVPSLASTPLNFRLAPRMTRTGGTTTRFRHRQSPFDVRYEIAIASTLLFQTFLDVDRPIRVNGCPCANRLEALLRIMEHEMIHLVEMLIWNNSRCSATRFQSIASRFFGHSDHRHHLVTQRERASAQFGVQPGKRVRFRFDGREYTGTVNRINRRATVLVEDPQGTPYTDGRCYRKFYVPLGALEPADGRHV